MKSKQHISIYNIAFAGVMAAIIYVLTMFRFPSFGSKVHFANAMCLLAGLLFGPLGGGLAAGIGSALYDLLVGGYGVVEALITFVMKFLMAFICAKIAGADGRTVKHSRIMTGCVTGLLTLWLSSLPGSRGTLPVNAITPIIGVPVVIYIILNRRRINYFN